VVHSVGFGLYFAAGDTNPSARPDTVLIALRDDTSTVATDPRWAVVRVVVDHAPAELHVDREALTAFAVVGESPPTEPFFSRG
jgi:hypothetical protein